eukprot:scaffold101956_cov41-Attheya_sp.AAC.1
MSQSALKNHQINFCAEATTGFEQGSTTDKVCKKFALIEPNKVLWEESLKWFTNTDSVPQPVPIRRAIFDKINRRTKDNNETLEWRDTATPFIIMAFLLPAMILAPLEAGHSDSISSRVHDRIKQFKSGEAKALLNEVRATKCWTPLEKRERAEQAGANTTAAAQGAADSRHLGGCMKQILNACPP